MGLITRLKSAIDIFRWGTTIDPIKLGGSYFIPISSSSSTYNQVDALRSFTEIPEVNAVINTKARMFSRMQVEIVSKTTGEPAKNYEYLVKVLRNPNWYQAQKEFLRQTKLFRDIFGNEYLYFNKAFGLPFTSVKSMYTLPPNMVITKTPQDMPFYMYHTPVIEYEFQWGNEKYQLDQSAMIQLNDNRVNISKENWVTGESKLTSLKVPINNIRAAYEARNVLIENRGALGILSNAGKDVAGTLPMDRTEKETLQKELQTYGLSKQKAQWIITNLALEWQQISIDDPQKLGLFPEVESDFQRICDAFGVDRDMFANEKGATWENKKQGERATWNNTIIPEAMEWIDALNDTFETQDKSWTIVGTFENIPALQENLKERGQALQLVTGALGNALTAGVITVEDYKLELAKYGIGEAAS